MKTRDSEALIQRFVGSLDLPGAGYYWGDAINVLPNDSLLWVKFVRSLYQGDIAKDFSEYLRLLGSKGEKAGTCLLGGRFAFLELTSIFKHPSGIIVFDEISPSALSERNVREFFKRADRHRKKELKRLFRDAKPWSNSTARPYIDECLALLARKIEEERNKAVEESFFDTLRSYEDFVESFSHEALSPIQEIKTTLNLVSRDIADPLSKQAKLIYSATTALEKLRVSLEAMRLLFNPEETVTQNRFREIDLLPIVKEWVEVYSRQFSAKNILVIQTPEMIWSAYVIKEYIEVLIKNLVDNAAKYSFDASSYDTSGKVIVKWDNFKQQMSFISYGVSISPKEISDGSLFRLAERGEDSSDRGRTGRGVGMYLVGQIVRLHRADIEVKSDLQNPMGVQQFYRNEFAIRFATHRKLFPHKATTRL